MLCTYKNGKHNNQTSRIILQYNLTHPFPTQDSTLGGGPAGYHIYVVWLPKKAKNSLSAIRKQLPE